MKYALGMAGRMLSYHLIAMILGMLFLAGLGENLYWLQVIINVLLLVGYGFLLYSDGGYRGEKAATMTATVAKRREGGQNVDPDMIAQCFNKATAIKGYVLGIALPLILAVVNLAVAPMYPTASVSPEQSQRIEQLGEIIAQSQADPEEAERLCGELGVTVEEAQEEYEAFAEEMSKYPINWVNIVTRVAFMPYVAVYTPLAGRPDVLNALFVLFSVLAPLAEPIGYLNGPRLRKRKLEAIQKGKRRKMRNLRVNKKPRPPKKPKMEV